MLGLVVCRRDITVRCVKCDEAIDARSRLVENMGKEQSSKVWIEPLDEQENARKEGKVVEPSR